MNEEHLNIYREGVTAWNQWREANPYIQPDLSSASLDSGADYIGANFSYAILYQATFADGTFRGADFDHADLRGANMSYADLRGANMSYADLTEAKLTEAKLNGTNLSQADLSQADLYGAHIFGTNLSTARNLTQLQLDTVLGCNDATLPNELVCNKRIILPPGSSLFDA
jgi:uncharacterized protein YjbI with pentapeptide repeats